MTVTSVHVLRYDQGRGWEELRGARPESARYWHPGVYAKRDSSDVPIPDEREWTVLATWDDEKAWRRAMDGPGPWAGARETWSCLLSPTPTRPLPADPVWADGTTTPPFGAAMLEEPTGPVAVVTTVALTMDLEPVLRFARDVEAIVESLPGTQGYLGHRLGGAEDFPQSIDTFTFSLWASWADARAWAYRAGVHARAMRDHMGGEHITRGSFTTFGVLDAVGSSEVIAKDIERLLSQPSDKRFRLTQALTP